MDVREGMTLQGSASYYLNRGGFGGLGPSLNVHGGGSSTPQAGGGLHTPQPGYKTLSNSNQNISVHPNVDMVGNSMSGSNFHVENPSPNYPHGMSMSMVSSSVSPGGGSETVKKKRGRPRKYGPDGSNMSLGLSPMAGSKASPGAIVSGERARRGRPPGSGWKQKLAPLGEWMNASAGLAFTPHVLHIGIGEDIAAKVLAFAQQRPRALCILSATGSVSVVTLRQPTTSGGTVTYEGRFEILCLSGSYLVSENGGPRNRIGGISISVCSPDGHMIGGAIGGKLTAASPVQVVACSFVYGGTTKAKNTPEPEIEHSANKSTPTSSVGPSQNPTTNSGPSSRQDIKISQANIDLMRG